MSYFDYIASSILIILSAITWYYQTFKWHNKENDGRSTDYFTYVLLLVGNLFWMISYVLFNWDNTLVFTIIENVLYSFVFIIFSIAYKEKFNMYKILGLLICFVGGYIAI